ncbi:MAG: hypothetical protein U1A78_25360 [Polyangia bacterium]
MSRSMAVLLQVATGVLVVAAIVVCGLLVVGLNRRWARQRRDTADPAEREGDEGGSHDGDRDPDDRTAKPTAPFLHSRHWAVLASEEDPRRFLLNIFERMLTPGSGAGAVVRGDLCHLVDRRGRLMFSALIRKGEALELLAMYPYTESPHVWPLTVRAVEESPDGAQARLLCSCQGAQVAVFDTLYLKNRQTYQLGEVYDFQVSGICYQIEADSLGPGFAKEFTGYGPLERFAIDQEAAPDEVVFHSLVEDVFDTEFWGVELLVYVLTLATPGDVPMRIELYTHPALSERRFQVGERVRGVAWLFAMWPDPGAIALAEALKAAHLVN